MFAFTLMRDCDTLFVFALDVSMFVSPHKDSSEVRSILLPPLEKVQIHDVNRDSHDTQECVHLSVSETRPEEFLRTVRFTLDKMLPAKSYYG